MRNNRYLIIGYQRSGTTVIHLLLKGHPNIAALNDELPVTPFFTQGISTFTHGNDLEEEKSRGYTFLFDALTSVLAKDITTTLGAKCVCNSTTNAWALVKTLQKYLKDLKIILIVRNDLVAQYGSMISSQKTGIMHSWYKGFENRKTSELTINKWLFIRYVIACLDTYNVFRELHKTHDVIESIYEDFLVNPASVQKQLFNFLDVPEVDVTWLASKKVMPAPEKYIKNYSYMTSLLEQLRADHASNSISPATVILAKVIARLYYMFNLIDRRRSRQRTKVKMARKEGRARSLAH